MGNDIIVCRSYDDDYCTEFGYDIVKGYPCNECPYNLAHRESDDKNG